MQKEVLETLSNNWDLYDVFTIVVPTAGGKTALSKTIMNSLYSVSTITPNNLLVRQFLDEFPDTRTLHKMSSYYCDTWMRPCGQARAKQKGFCSGCKCSSDISQAKYKDGPGIYNYWIDYAHKLHRKVLIVDEAHNLASTIKEIQAIKIWQHDYHYPNNMVSEEDTQLWISKLDNKKQQHKKIKLLREAVTYKVPTHKMQRSLELFNGKGTERGVPELRDCIKLLPVDISQSPEYFWPRDITKKIILMSATIGPKDIEELGLQRKRVLYIEARSPIDPASRPIIPLDFMSINYQTQVSEIVAISKEIENIASYHPGEKGVVHVSYSLARSLQEHIKYKRFIFHSQSNKKEQYELFRKKSPDSGSVLVASGFYEGIDLPEDLGRWQIIAKIPWQSLISPSIKHLAELDPDWYVWQTAKTTIQACGRICRTPEDYGITYCLDSSFNRLYKDGEHMMPQWFKEAIQWPKKNILT